MKHYVRLKRTNTSYETVLQGENDEETVNYINRTGAGCSFCG